MWGMEIGNRLAEKRRRDTADLLQGKNKANQSTKHPPGFAAAAWGTSSIARFSPVLVRLVLATLSAVSVLRSSTIPGPSASDNTKQAKQVRHPPTPHDSFNKAYQSKKGREINQKWKSHKISARKKQKKQGKGRSRLNQLHQLVARVV